MTSPGDTVRPWRARARLGVLLLLGCASRPVVASAQSRPPSDAALYRRWTAGQGGAPGGQRPDRVYPAVRTTAVRARGATRRVVPRASARDLPVRQDLARPGVGARPWVQTQWAEGAEASHAALAELMRANPDAVLVAAPRVEETRTFVLHGPAHADGPVRADGTREVTHEVIELSVDGATGAQRLVVHRALVRDWARHPALVARPWLPPDAPGGDAPDAISEVFAVSDTHGHFDELTHLLQVHGLIAPTGRGAHRWTWRGGDDGRAALVIAGDVFNRGPESLRTLDLVRDLSAQARGRVIVTMGNQESELIGDPGSFRAWRDDAKAHGILTEARWRGISPRYVSDPRSARGAFVANMPVVARIGDGPHGFVFFHAGKTHGMSAAQLTRLTREAEDVRGMDSEPFLRAGVFLNAADAMARSHDDKAADLHEDARRLGGEHLVMGHAPDAFGKDPAELAVTPGRAGATFLIDSSLGTRGDGRLLRVRWQRGRDGTWHQVAHSLDPQGNARWIWSEPQAHPQD